MNMKKIHTESEDPKIYRRVYDINTALGFDSNDKVKFKLRVIEVFERSGLEVTQLAFPGISRRTIYRLEKKVS